MLPYIAHPLEVMSLLRYVGGVRDEALLAAAALHDVVESGATTLEEIEARLGPEIAFHVGQMTRREPTEQEVAGLDKDAIWSLRSELLLEDIRKMSRETWPLKLADRLSNLREARHAKKGKKLARYRKQTRRILEIIPESANPGLWRATQDELEK